MSYFLARQIATKQAALPRMRLQNCLASSETKLIICTCFVTEVHVMNQFDGSRDASFTVCANILTTLEVEIGLPNISPFPIVTFWNS